MTIRFQEEHLRVCSEASLDYNPLHLSENYARKTPAGQRVVYGVLGAAVCLAHATPDPGQVFASINLDFRSPLLLDVEYAIRVKRDGLRTTVAIMDGSAIMMRARFDVRAGSPEFVDLPENGCAPLRQARLLHPADFSEGRSFSGQYAPPRKAYLDFLQLCGIDRRQSGDALPILLLCSSYLVGMEMPGESATYISLAGDLPHSTLEAPFGFQLALASYDERFGLLKLRFSLGGFARGEIGALARPMRGALTASLASSDDLSESFAGKTALVVGASRGLGAAMALRLVAAGCNVVGAYSHSSDDAAILLAAARDLPGSLIMQQGDAGDPSWCRALREKIAADFGGLDLLICNAAPALQSMRVEEAYQARIESYIQKGLTLVLSPLTAFIATLSERHGTVLLISSSAVESPPRVWPHYVALKAAAEALMRTASLDYPAVRFHTARPGKIRTDLTNTPSGWNDAEDPDAVAARLLTQLRST